MQDLLFDSGTLEKDVVYTPDWCARDMVQHFKPTGRVLEPCKGGGAFLQYLPVADWCEIAEGHDFFRCFERYDWLFGNPPYSCIPKWCRHSFQLADDVVYLIPCRSVFLGPTFVHDLYTWGGIVEMRHYGGGSALGFPMGNAVAAFHFRKGWQGDMKVTHYKQPNVQIEARRAFAPSLSNAGLGVTMEISDGTLILARYAVDNLLRQYDLTDEGLPKTAMARRIQEPTATVNV